MRLYAGIINPIDPYTLRCQTDLDHSYLPSNCYYNGVLQLGIVTSVGTKSTEFFCEPNSTPRELGAAEQPPVSAAASSSAGVLNEANVNSLLLAALKQFEEQATDWLLWMDMT